MSGQFLRLGRLLSVLPVFVFWAGWCQSGQSLWLGRLVTVWPVSVVGHQVSVWPVSVVMQAGPSGKYVVRQDGHSLASLCGWAYLSQSGQSLWIGRLIPVLPESVVS